MKFRNISGTAKKDIKYISKNNPYMFFSLHDNNAELMDHDIPIDL